MLKEYIERKELNEWLEEERFKFEEQIDFTPDEDELNSDEYELYERGYFRCFDNVMSIVNDVPVVELDDSRLKWISVEDRLPEPMEWVLCFCQGNIIEVLRYDHIMDDWDRTMPNRCYMRGFVTHWMPLPKPPKGEQP